MVHLLDLQRLIPAWAGKTVTHGPPPRPPAAHPRVGGENARSCTTLDGADGSSPRGRGKRRDRHGGPGSRRLIPAWAGKTAPAPPSSSSTEAHPRVGGENRRWRREHRAGVGSSPRGRGKRGVGDRRSVRNRLIPAWAGKTGGDTAPCQVVRAHPRVGGENPVRPRVGLGCHGSSPRGRGKPRLHAGPGHLSRLIPAWAGKTVKFAAYADGGMAHPRVGGENAVTTAEMVLQSWLIPAWAGKTGLPGRRRTRQSAHPRVGGENWEPMRARWDR